MKTTVILCLCLSLMACADNASTDNNQPATPTSTSTEKPNKFKVAASNKIKLANPGMTDEKANCVVEQMTADGKIGLGEINQMQLDAASLSNNASNLVTAYQNALSNCN